MPLLGRGRPEFAPPQPTAPLARPLAMVSRRFGERSVMAAPAPLYDLVLILSGSLEDEPREKIVATVEETITGGGGEIVSRHDWGARSLAFEIRHQKDGVYRLLQFHAPAPVLERLSGNLRITEGVIRFRLIKLRPGTPDPPAPPRQDTPPPRPAAATDEPAAA